MTIPKASQAHSRNFSGNKDLLCWNVALGPVTHQTGNFQMKIVSSFS